MSAPTIIPTLDKIFAVHGLPKTIISDNSPPFEFEKFVMVYGIKHNPTPPKWPRVGGTVENFNEPILRAIRTAHIERHNWRHELYDFLLNYRSTPHSTTGIPPAELLFHGQIPTKLPHYPSKLNTRVMENLARQNDLEHKVKNKRYTDTRAHARTSDIKVGDYVLVLQDKTNKLSTHFDPGLFLVT